ncbi:hypothetical protein TWF106_002177 [Orbilia oligospora]|uniref:Uncharacterized protein n=1 Tax=Orbilia oligospora TaxID=2813651 RepID=A0A7C8Q213_ORBOL|nr:hypothetical protein TWF788_001391 [Orbilia oligospora]KAF3219453.1 hypothetical protein TWF679_010922 [Orbilia oligospora]KAF3224501.1 hypothetical protein TWF191_005969 [Orbilia oligospora]KAF3225661.1 hypothetical protein TWF106_002177 [Orbilia oligospora]
MSNNHQTSNSMTPPARPALQMTPPARPNLRFSPGANSGYFDSSPVRTTPPLLRHRTSSRSGSIPHTPDRFIPSSASVQSFRINTPASRRPEEGTRARRRSASPTPRARTARTRSISSNRVGVGHFPGAINFDGSRRSTRPLFGFSPDGQANASQQRQGYIVNATMDTADAIIQEEHEMHEERLALALGVNLDGKVMSFDSSPSPEKRSSGLGQSPMKMELGTWSPTSPQMEIAAAQLKKRRDEMRKVVSTPDDFYCTLLAYSPVSKVLAVALGSDIYGWTERGGAKPFKPWATTQITAIAFSSTPGKLDILAVGRVDGVISLWGLGESVPRAEAQHQAAVACVSFKPFESKRRGLGNRKEWTRCEDLLLGDESGNIYFYAIEWDPELGSVACGMTLVRRMKVHTQQICGIAWSTDASQVATGGNDNQCILFDVETPKDEDSDSRDADEPNRELIIRHKWSHQAAVKAIAFCPWQKSLIATGGGSNDRGIHFYHTFTGSSIATINVSAQVTSLVWSNQRKEIAATFGYANPEHPIRIAVFTWPDCHKVVSIPWAEDMRALYALPYPGGPPESKNGRSSNSENGGANSVAPGSTDPKYEGCLVVAASDETIRFHEVWGVVGPKGKSRRQCSTSALGSEILETLEGIEKEGPYKIR